MYRLIVQISPVIAAALTMDVECLYSSQGIDATKQM